MLCSSSHFTSLTELILLRELGNRLFIYRLLSQIYNIIITLILSTILYEKLANRINKDFRAYREKGKPQTKIEQLTEQIKCAFKIGETDTCKSVAKRFYEIAQTAVSIEASMTLEMQQAQSEIIAETAVMTMGG